MYGSRKRKWLFCTKRAKIFTDRRGNSKLRFSSVRKKEKKIPLVPFCNTFPLSSSCFAERNLFLRPELQERSFEKCEKSERSKPGPKGQDCYERKETTIHDWLHTYIYIYIYDSLRCRRARATRPGSCWRTWSWTRRVSTVARCPRTRLPSRRPAFKAPWTSSVRKRVCADPMPRDFSRFVACTTTYRNGKKCLPVATNPTPSTYLESQCEKKFFFLRCILLITKVKPFQGAIGRNLIVL